MGAGSAGLSGGTVARPRFDWGNPWINLKTEDGRAVLVPIIDTNAIRALETRGHFVDVGGDSGGWRYEQTAVNLLRFDAWGGEAVPVPELTERNGIMVDVRDAAEFDYMVGWSRYGEAWASPYPDAASLRQRFTLGRWVPPPESGGGN